MSLQVVNELAERVKQAQAMNLNQSITPDERKAIESLIKANDKRQVAKLALYNADRAWEEASNDFYNSLHKTTEDDLPGSCVPEWFVYEFGGELFLFQVDVDGDHCHRINRIGIITKE